MDPLSRDENYPRQLTPEMWREIKSAPPEVIAEMQDDLKHGNTYYTGVETGKGVLLFGRDYVGNRQYGDFMATNIEKRFFEPDFEEKYLNVYELRGWPSLMEGKVNRCCDDYGCLLPLEKIPADAFVDKSAIRNLLHLGAFNLGSFGSLLVHLVSDGNAGTRTYCSTYRSSNGCPLAFTYQSADNGTCCCTGATADYSTFGLVVHCAATAQQQCAAQK